MILTPDQETVGPAEEMGVQDMTKEAECAAPVFHIHFLTHTPMKKNYALSCKTSKSSPPLLEGEYLGLSPTRVEGSYNTTKR
jgi:hypothetical protein